MPQKWAIWLSVQGDLRFLSHHDMLRMLERLASRAKLPLHYSQGFNPRAAISLAIPRPVGVASLDDLLVMTLDESVEESRLLEALAGSAPPGLALCRAQILPPGIKTLPKSATYQLPLQEHDVAPVQARIEELAKSPAWLIERQLDDEGNTRQVDVRPLVRDIAIQDNTLKIALAPVNDIWARPGEVLRLLGLDERLDLARMVRVSVDYGL